MRANFLVESLSYLNYSRVRRVSRKVKDAYAYSHPEFTLIEKFDVKEREQIFEYAEYKYGKKVNLKPYLF
jgi:hypothetical protein